MSNNVLITGATGGIGLATAKAFGTQGCTVLINGIDTEQAKAAMQELERLGIQAEFFHFDVTNEDAVNAGIAAIEQKYDHLDVLVNNAGGIGGRSRFEAMATTFYRSVMALNLDSAFFVSRACIPLLKKSGSGNIVNIASIAGWNAGGPGAGIYATAKAAIVTLTRALAKDLVEYGIRVNAVSPGTIDTAFHDNIRKTNPALFESWKNNILLKRFGQPQDVADVIAFLCSKQASYITGEIIQINGGQEFL